MSPTHVDPDETLRLGVDMDGVITDFNAGWMARYNREFGTRLRAGQVNLNGASPDMMAPFGGYKMSGNGREWGDHAFAEFLETKAVLGYSPKQAAE